ncbi:DUF2255 family protein [Isoptericola sp. S6320L]|uniref:DUF2255 family protein n=1 Tax=Isoptericola sp. S6320L TaxID=2926411 RepID=UPI001FF468C0|nr:DUF2255 family protein [Isoptericola sp. S6320L]MCK0116724.1 DUF2255 family protein [Isoptericola sp. S6320L]
MPTAALEDLASLPTAQLLTSDGAGPGSPAWLVSLGRDLYMRSAPGGERLRPGGGRARVRVADVVHHVTLAEVAPEVHGLLDDAYRAKYGHCTPDRVSDVAAATTFRVSTRRPSLWERTAPLLDRGQAWWDRVRPVRGEARAGEVPCPTC